MHLLRRVSVAAGTPAAARLGGCASRLHVHPPAGTATPRSPHKREEAGRHHLQHGCRGEGLGVNVRVQGCDAVQVAVLLSEVQAVTNNELRLNVPADVLDLNVSLDDLGLAQ